MYEKILYATDFSEMAKKAFQYVKELKEAGAKDVVLLHVVDKRVFDGIATQTAIDALSMEKEWVDTVFRQIAAVENDLKNEGFSVKTRIEKGVPFKEIISVANEEDASVIVMGSHGKGNIPEMLLGSVTEKVVRKSAKPVLVVKW